jgi:hypothetical protein
MEEPQRKIPGANNSNSNPADHSGARVVNLSRASKHQQPMVAIKREHGVVSLQWEALRHRLIPGQPGNNSSRAVGGIRERRLEQQRHPPGSNSSKAASLRAAQHLKKLA